MRKKRSYSITHKKRLSLNAFQFFHRIALLNSILFGKLINFQYAHQDNPDVGFFELDSPQFGESEKIEHKKASTDELGAVFFYHPSTETPVELELIGFFLESQGKKSWEELTLEEQDEFKKEVERVKAEKE